MNDTDPPVRPTIGIDVGPRSILVRMQGDLDVATAPRLDRVLDDLIAEAAHRADHDVPSMTIDLEAVGLLSAAGMAVLLRARGAADRSGVTCRVCVNGRARRALALTGLDRVLLPVPLDHRPVV
ncbi:STAS domain-containing protein [Actinomycetospora sp. OC33-EN08]|uniref:STAS domain-containing protein n=1 Tax=Actinomycetospora aurantiaca TaxID=3129233 RepID=A0ABU8MUI6_9PSEU